MTKIGHKLIKIAQNCIVLCAFSVSILLKFLRLVDWGARPPEAPPPVYAPDCRVGFIEQTTVKIRSQNLLSA